MSASAMRSERLGTAAALIFLVLAPGAARAEIGGLLTRAFPPGEEACFAHVSGAAQVARNARQNVTAVHFFKALTPDPQREEMEHPRAVQIEKDRKGEPNGIWSEGKRWLSVLVRFKDKPGRVYGQEVECSGTDGDGFGCGRDCDGGGVGVEAKGDALLLQPGHLRLRTSCDADPEGDLHWKSDGDPVRVERRPMEACLAERTAARPAFAAATPLRVRFAERASVCHGRSYDAKHLAQHPKQNIAAITLRTREKVKLDTDDSVIGASFAAEIAVKARNGATARAIVTCHAREFAFTCLRDGGSENFEVIRDGERGLRIRDLNFRKSDGDTTNYLAALFDVPLGDDDRVFRLDERDDPACALR